jgi:predicted nucleotidyltransferase
MNSFGKIVKKLREESGLTLQTVATSIDINQEILSTMEREHHSPTREQVTKFAEYFKVNENDLLVAWFSEKIVHQLEDEEIAIKALQMAEEEIAYKAFKKTDRAELIRQLVKGVEKIENIQKVWIYGSFARGDDGPKSDIDIAFQTDKHFSYFDLAEVQFQLEKLVNRKVDVGFIDSFKPYILEHVKPDLKLIYERQSY